MYVPYDHVSYHTINYVYHSMYMYTCMVKEWHITFSMWLHMNLSVYVYTWKSSENGKTGIL